MRSVTENGKELVLRAESESDEDGEFTADWFYRSVFACARSLCQVEGFHSVGGAGGRRLIDLIGTEDEGYELLSQATNWSGRDRSRRRCLHISGVADLHPLNGAGHDAKISIESLRTKIGSDRNA